MERNIKPYRRYVITIEAQGNEVADIVNELHTIANKLPFISQNSSWFRSGDTSEIRIYLREDSEQTHEKYIAQLKEYLSKIAQGENSDL